MESPSEESNVNETAKFEQEALISLCRGLSDENKVARKRCILKIRSHLNDLPHEKLAQAVEVIFKDLLRAFNDPSEACREQSVMLVSDFLPEIQSIEPFLTFLLTILVKRISSGDNKEPSEEIRLLLFKLLSGALQKAKGCNLIPYLDDLSKVLCSGLADDFPDVKSACCDCTKDLVLSAPKNFHVQCETYLKSLIPVALHKHSRVRAAAISTIGVVIQYGTHNLVEKVAQVLAERLYDSSPAVRKAVVSIGGDWLCNLPDRYSQFCRIIPLVIIGMDDEMPEIREIAFTVWDKAGRLFEMENEDELKNELDYGIKNLPNYPLKEPRPRIGCRVLIQQNAMKLIPATLKELHDWNAGVRMQSASLLYQLIRHLESKCIQHLQRLWPDLCLKCIDPNDQLMQKNIEQCIFLLGYFVPENALLQVAIPQDELTMSQLCCLSAALKGLTTLEEPYLATVCQALCKSVNTNMELSYQNALLNCTANTLYAARRAKSDETKAFDRASSLSLFTVLLNLMGNSQSLDISSASKVLVNDLVDLLETSNPKLFELYGEEILTPILSTVSVWTEYCAPKNIFIAFTREAGVGIGVYLPLVVDILITWGQHATTGVDLADMVRVAMPILSWKFLESCAADPEKILLSLINGLIQPNLKWSAGRVAEAKRSQALVLLVIAVSDPEVPDSIFAHMATNFPPLLMTMLEEMSNQPRLGAAQVLEILCLRWKKLNLLDLDTTFRIVQVAAERLDDVKAEVRLQALRVVKAALPHHVPPSYKSHLELLYKTALIHLDDQDLNYSAAVLDTLRVIGMIDIELLTKLLGVCRKKFSRQDLCDELINYVTKNNDNM
ncbi:dynein axonemal assembly factor 5 isoform X2 [Neocloeon triangulifer]|uniref:dynein axonemal assembly factor 5 isoform X2 n=1 Tax=Neocloeon triangulifer TaxID=2078957 RepID=UPI00286F8579|nr:dynein axonemal assembly factor 5 isoform X2 [Neocloeon triangulifer]